MSDFPPPPPSEGDFPPPPPDDASVPRAASSQTGKFSVPPALVVLSIIGALIYGGSVVYQSVAARTALLYGFCLDGKDIPQSARPEVRVDGQLFESGEHLKPGRHKLSVMMMDSEPYERVFWVFCGTKELGKLPLQTSKGSLFVTSSPSPTTVTIQRGGEDFTNGSTPFKLDILAVGRYRLFVKRGDYEETRDIEIQRQMTTATNVSLNLGNVDLSADPTDAEFELTGNSGHWQGYLPTNIEDVPAGRYSLVVSRKGWGISNDVFVSRGSTATKNTEFPYGSIEVTSDPTGLLLTTNGGEIGRSPRTLQGLRPGEYVLTATDGSNDLRKTITIGPKEAARLSFPFRYGSVLLRSTPPGAAILRNGKEVGKTPFTLDSIPVGEVELELELTGYASTNARLNAVDGMTNESAVKLVSLDYLKFMSNALQASTDKPPNYAKALDWIREALVIASGDSDALQLRSDCEYGLDFDEALRLRDLGDLDGALAKIDAAIAIKPSDAANELRSKITQAIQGSVQKRIFELEQEFGDVVSAVIFKDKGVPITTAVLPSTNVIISNVHLKPAGVRDAVLKAIDMCNPKWQVESEANPSLDRTVIYLRKAPAGSSPDHLIVQTCQLPNHDVDVRANVVTVVQVMQSTEERQKSGLASLADFISSFRTAVPKGSVPDK